MNQILIIFVCITLTGCSIVPDFIEENAQNESIFKSENCTMPCFRDIIPGITSYVDATKVIEKFAVLETDGWYAYNNRESININIVRSSPIGDDYVSYIELRTQNQIGVTSLEELIDIQNTPIRVFISDVGGLDTVNLLFVFGKSQEILAFVNASTKIDGDSQVYTLIFMSSQDKNWILEDKRAIWGFDTEVQWIGYASVDDYRMLRDN